MLQHFAACSLLKWKGFAGIFLYRHIKVFMTYNVDMGPKRITFRLLPGALLEVPVEAAGPGPSLSRLHPGRRESWCRQGQEELEKRRMYLASSLRWKAGFRGLSGNCDVT